MHNQYYKIMMELLLMSLMNLLYNILDVSLYSFWEVIFDVSMGKLFCRQGRLHTGPVARKCLAGKFLQIGAGTIQDDLVSIW